MIRFTDSADSILEYPMSRVILIDASLQSKDAVIDRIEKALEAPYNEDNWDGFRDAITDLSWLACPSVVLVHKALPKMNAWDLKTYLELLYDVSKEWDSGNCEKGFYVYFSLEDKPQIDFYLPGKRLSSQVLFTHHSSEFSGGHRSLLVVAFLAGTDKIVPIFPTTPLLGDNVVESVFFLRNVISAVYAFPRGLSIDNVSCVLAYRHGFGYRIIRL